MQHQYESKVSVGSMPPVVIETFPRAGDTAVDPSIQEIRVTFSKDMMTDGMWSWCRTYAIWFNTPKYDAFRDENSNPAVPYLLVFETRGQMP